MFHRDKINHESDPAASAAINRKVFGLKALAARFEELRAGSEMGAPHEAGPIYAEMCTVLAEMETECARMENQGAKSDKVFESDLYNLP